MYNTEGLTTGSKCIANVHEERNLDLEIFSQFTSDADTVLQTYSQHKM